MVRKKNPESTNLVDFIYGLDDQKRCLEGLLLDFKQKREGGSCLLSGRKNSGKKLLLNSLIGEHFAEDDKDIRVVRIDGSDYDSCTATGKMLERMGFKEMVDQQRAVDEEENGAEKCGRSAGTRLTGKNEASSSSMIEPHLIVINHFERCALKQHQSLLYFFLNGSQSYPWFIILIGTREDCVTLLEKRVRSRLSKQKISFKIQPDFDEFVDGFEKFMAISTVSLAVFKKITDDDANYKKMLRYIYHRHDGFFYSKQLVMLFEKLNRKYEELDPIKLLSFCIEAILPTNEKQRVLAAYIRFTNEFNKSIHVSNFVLFKDLDEMIALKVLSPIKGFDFGQLQFRKVTLNVEAETIVNCMRSNKEMPTSIMNWVYH